MSVLIKNIEFPQKCSECDFRNRTDGYWYCGAYHFEEIGKILPYDKADFCPLIEAEDDEEK